ncbi:MAG: hypothetical protein ACUBOA_12470 [Candidatus Loosdrechtia sp.]|uniref:hypothetical protein n=1 Tax=Candidatus Loosdrechtia sp. TaxID=3101272 RepID=UPI003A66957B|nr:MAG: hypothetical protein QY305_01935 [Candidatus Jettenia sp. AMX2]
MKERENKAHVERYVNRTRGLHQYKARQEHYWLTTAKVTKKFKDDGLMEWWNNGVMARWNNGILTH